MQADPQTTLERLQAQKAKLAATQNKIDSLGQMMGIKSDKLNALLAEIKALEGSGVGGPELAAKIAALNAMLEEATKSVQAITPTQIDEIAKYNNPPERIKNGLEALLYLLKGKKLEWEEIRSLMKKPDFTESVLKFNVAKVAPKVVAHVKREYIQKDFWDMEKLKKASKAMGPLGQWLESQVQLCEVMEQNPEAKQALENVQTLEIKNLEAFGAEQEVQEARAELDQAQREAEELAREVAELEEQARLDATKVVEEPPEPVQVLQPPPERVSVRASLPAPAPEPIVKGPGVEGGTQSDLSVFGPDAKTLTTWRQTGSVSRGMNFGWIQRNYINLKSFNPTRPIDRRTANIATTEEHGFGGPGMPQGWFDAGSQTDDFFTFEILNGWAQRQRQAGTDPGPDKYPPEAQTVFVPVPANDAGQKRPETRDFSQNLDEELLITFIRRISLNLATREELEHELGLRDKYARRSTGGKDLSGRRAPETQVDFSQAPAGWGNSLQNAVRRVPLVTQDHQIFIKFSTKEIRRKESDKSANDEFGGVAMVTLPVNQPVRVGAEVVPMRPSRMVANEIQFHNAVQNPIGLGSYYEKRDRPSAIITSAHQPVQLRRTIVRTTDTVLDGPGATAVQLAEPQVISTNVVRRVTRSYSSTPLSGSPNMLTQALAAEPMISPIITNEVQTRYLQAEPRRVQAEYVTPREPVLMAPQGSAFLKSIPVPIAPIPGPQVKVVERDGSQFGIPSAQLGESMMSTISGIDRAISNNRIVYGEPATSTYLIERETPVSSTMVIRGRGEPTTQLRFVNHPMTQQSVRYAVDRSSPNGKFPEGPVAAEQTGIRLYKQVPK